jgi:ketosteroid isomerase-like protein
MPEENKQLLKKISEEFAKGNLDYAAAYLKEDVRWNILGDDPVIGKAEVLEVSKMLQLQSFPVITIWNVIAEGNYVVVESSGQATTTSGKAYDQTYCEVFRFDNEKVTEITTYLDTALSKEVNAD